MTTTNINSWAALVCSTERMCGRSRKIRNAVRHQKVYNRKTFMEIPWRVTHWFSVPRSSWRQPKTLNSATFACRGRIQLILCIISGYLTKELFTKSRRPYRRQFKDTGKERTKANNDSYRLSSSKAHLENRGSTLIPPTLARFPTGSLWDWMQN